MKYEDEVYCMYEEQKRGEEKEFRNRANKR